MSERTAARVAWILWALTFCEVVVFAVLAAQRWSLLQSSRAIAIQSALLGVAYPIMGALIASKRPKNPIGWIFLVVGLSGATSAIANALTTDSPMISGAGAPAGALWGVWLNQWVWAPGWIAIPTLVLLLFPDGRLPHRRFRPIAWLAVISIAAASVSGILSPDEGGDAAHGFHNPVVIFPKSVDNFIIVAILALLLAGLGSIAGLVYRFRRSHGDQREQLKWFVFAAVATIVLYFGLTVEAKTGFLQALGFIAIPLLPTATAIAILRYRLYDIDRIISRTLAYAIVTLFLGGAFALVALVPTLLIGTGAKTPEWLIATATLLVVALFRPVRRRVQDSIDHRFNRRRYDAAQTIDTFTARLRDEVDISTLSGDLETVVRQTMQPAHVSVWLKDRVTGS